MLAELTYTHVNTLLYNPALRVYIDQNHRHVGKTSNRTNVGYRFVVDAEIMQHTCICFCFFILSIDLIAADNNITHHVTDRGPTTKRVRTALM